MTQEKIIREASHSIVAHTIKEATIGDYLLIIEGFRTIKYDYTFNIIILIFILYFIYKIIARVFNSQCSIGSSYFFV